MSSRVIDDWGESHEVAGPMPRILSLVPSITELLFDLGLSGSIVGRTMYCVRPEPAVLDIPSVGGTKKISMDRVRELRPTHAIVNVDENPEEMARELAEMEIEVIVTHPIEVSDNIRLFRMMGELFDRREEAEQLTRTLNARLESLGPALTRSIPVLYLIWRDPWMTVSPDTYISKMLRLVGWETLDVSNGVRYPTVDLADALPRVSIVLLSSEPYAFEPGDVESFRRAHPTFTGNVSWIDGAAVSWYGSRSIAGIDYLASLVRNY